MDGTVARADMRVRYLGMLEKDMEEVLRRRSWVNQDTDDETLLGVLRFAAEGNQRLIDGFFRSEQGVLDLLKHLCTSRPDATESFPETIFRIDHKPTFTSTMLMLSHHEKEVKFYIGDDFRFIRTSSPISEHAAMQHAAMIILQLYLMFVRLHFIQDIDATEVARRRRIQEHADKLEQDAVGNALDAIERRFKSFVENASRS